MLTPEESVRQQVLSGETIEWLKRLAPLQRCAAIAGQTRIIKDLIQWDESKMNQHLQDGSVEKSNV